MVMNAYQIIRKGVDCFLECDAVQNISAVKIWRLCYSCDIKVRGHINSSDEIDDDAFGGYFILSEGQIVSYLHEWGILTSRNRLEESVKASIDISTNTDLFKPATAIDSSLLILKWLWYSDSLKQLWLRLKDNCKKIGHHMKLISPCSYSFLQIQYYLENIILDFLIKVYPFLLRPEVFLRIGWHILNGFEVDTFRTGSRLDKQCIIKGKNIKRQERPLKRKILRDESAGENIDAIQKLKNERQKDRTRQCLSRERLKQDVINGDSIAIEAVVKRKAEQKIRDNRKKLKKDKLKRQKKLSNCVD
jgi:hypothetical protein